MIRLLRRSANRSSIATDVALTSSADIAIAGLGLVCGVFVARMLGPKGRGELAAIQTWPQVVATLSMLGVPEALTYYCAKQQQRAKNYLATAMALGTLGAGVGTVIAYCAMPWLLAAESGRIVSFARLYLILAFIYAVPAMLGPALRGIGKFEIWNLLRIGPLFGWLGVLLIAWMSGNKTPEFLAAMNLVALVVLFCPSIAIAYSRIPGHFKIGRSNSLDLLTYGLPCVMTGVPQMLNLRLDQMMMTVFVSPRQLGLYVVAVAWSGAVSPLVNGLSSVMLPAVASLNDREKAFQRLAMGVRIITILAVVACGLLLVITPVAIIALFGSRYRACIPAALILVPASGILAINLLLQEGVRGLGHPYTVLRAESYGLIMTVVLLLVLLRPLGMVGAAIASFIGYSTVTISLLASAKRITGVGIASMLIPRFDELKIIMLRGLALVLELTG